MRKERFDSMVAFKTPLCIPGICPIYGIAFRLGNRDTKEMAQNLDRYIKYLAGLCKWIEQGGYIDKGNTDIWYDEDGVGYFYSDSFITEFEKKANEERPIRYNVLFGSTTFKKEDLDGNFIIRI